MNKWANELTENSQNKKYKWPINIWRNAQHPWPHRKCSYNTEISPHSSQNGYHQECK
jgi:hypothetical protein